MSGHSDHHDFAVHSDADQLPGRRLSLIVVVVVATTLFWVGVAWWLLARTEADNRPSGDFYERDIAPPRVLSGINTTLIAEENHGEDHARTRRELLDSYGWVDRDRGVVRIPIERAMQIVAGEVSE